MNHIGRPLRQRSRGPIKRACYIGGRACSINFDLWEELEWELMERILNRVWYQTHYRLYTFNPDKPENHGL